MNDATGLSIEKLGKNITRGQSTPQTSLTAKPGDTLEFYIRVRSFSSSVLTNVLIRDIMPSGITYLAGTTSINNNLTADGITGSGISVGNLNPNSEVIIRFNARVNDNSFINGKTSLTNTIVASSNNSSSTSSNISIAITNKNTVITNVIKKASQISTGSNGAIVLSLLIAGLITAGYVLTRRYPQFALALPFGKKQERMPYDLNFLN